MTSTIPSTTPAWVLVDTGKPLALKEVPIPTVLPGDVLVKVVAASFNPIDFIFNTVNFLKFPTNGTHALGCDFSGVVVQVGSAVRRFKVGDEVYGIGNLARSGSFSQYFAADSELISLKPTKASHLEAAVIPAGFLSSFIGTTPRPNTWAYIPGGAGGVSHYAVQIAQLQGSKVIASGGNDASLKYLKDLKVDHVFNYKSVDPVEEVRKVSGGGVQYVFDAVYTNESHVQSAKTLAKGGILSVLGELGAEPKAEAEKLGAVARNHNLGLYAWDPVFVPQRQLLAGGLAYAAQAFDKGLIKGHIAKTVSFEKIGEELFTSKGRSPAAGKIAVQIFETKL